MEGWGGPARNGLPNGHPDKPKGGRPPGVKNGEGKAARARQALEDAAPMAVQTVIDIASDRNDQRALQAALAVLNRIGLHEKSGVEHTGADGAPIATSIEIRFVEPDGG